MIFKKQDKPKLFKCTNCRIKKPRKEFTIFTSIVKICTVCANAAAANDLDKKILGKKLSGYINQKLTNKLRKKGHSEEDITEAYKILNPKNNEKNIKKND